MRVSPVKAIAMDKGSTFVGAPKSYPNPNPNRNKKSRHIGTRRAVQKNEVIADPR
jgi:hypothetical protein